MDNSKHGFEKASASGSDRKISPDYIKNRFIELYKEHGLDFYRQLHEFSGLIKEAFPDWKRYLLYHQAIGSTPSADLETVEDDFPGDYSIYNFFAAEQKGRQAIINRIKAVKIRNLINSLFSEINSSSAEEKNERLKLIFDFETALLKKYPDAEKYISFNYLNGGSKVVSIDFFTHYDFTGNYSIENFLKVSWPNKKLMLEAIIKNE
jgi:hypothetical protein